MKKLKNKPQQQIERPLDVNTRPKRRQMAIQQRVQQGMAADHPQNDPVSWDARNQEGR